MALERFTVLKSGITVQDPFPRPENLKVKIIPECSDLKMWGDWQSLTITSKPPPRLLLRKQLCAFSKALPPCLVLHDVTGPESHCNQLKGQSISVLSSTQYKTVTKKGLSLLTKTLLKSEALVSRLEKPNPA